MNDKALDTIAKMCKKYNVRYSVHKTSSYWAICINIYKDVRYTIYEKNRFGEYRVEFVRFDWVLKKWSTPINTYRTNLTAILNSVFSCHKREQRLYGTRTR